MSRTNTNPMASLFELQRKSIRQGQRLAESGLDAGSAWMAATEQSLDAQKQAQKQALALGRNATQATLSWWSAAVPAADSETTRETVDEQYRAFDDRHSEAWNTYEAGVRQARRTYDQVSDAQRQMLGDSTDAVVEAHERFEAETTRATDRLTERSG